MNQKWDFNLRNIGILPIKSNSKRLPNKNFRDLCGKPLWRWTFDTLIKCNLFDHIYLSSDDINLFNIPNLNNISIVKRDKKLCQSNIHAIEVIFDILENYENNFSNEDNIMMLLPTSPFREKETIIKTCKLIKEKESAVIGIYKASKGSNSYRKLDPNNKLIRLPKFSDLHIQSSDIGEYIVTGSIFASRKSSLLEYKTFHQPKSYGLIVSEAESIDINTELDFLTASAYAEKYL